LIFSPGFFRNETQERTKKEKEKAEHIQANTTRITGNLQEQNLFQNPASTKHKKMMVTFESSFF